jgi:hypothetical protein
MAAAVPIARRLQRMGFLKSILRVPYDRRG